MSASSRLPAADRGEQKDEGVEVDAKNTDCTRRMLAGRKSQECEIAIRQRKASPTRAILRLISAPPRLNSAR